MGAFLPVWGSIALILGPATSFPGPSTIWKGKPCVKAVLRISRWQWNRGLNQALGFYEAGSCETVQIPYPLKLSLHCIHIEVFYICFLPFAPLHAWKWLKLWLLEMGLTKFSLMDIISIFHNLFSNSRISLLISPIIQSISLFLCFYDLLHGVEKILFARFELTENTASVLKLSWRNKQFILDRWHIRYFRQLVNSY